MINRDIISVLITAFNEEKMIGEVLEGLISRGYRNIVLIDDGSTDRTYDIAKGFDIVILRHIINRGKGASLQTGTEYILKKGFPIIVHFDADGQHNPDDIEGLVTPLLEEDFDVVFGSRFLGKTHGMPTLRRFILKGGIIFTNLLYGIKLTDVHNGMRAFKSQVFKKIVFTEDRFAYASELIEKIVKEGFKFKEVPVTIRYTDYSLGKGQRNINAINIIFKMIKRRLFA